MHAFVRGSTLVQPLRVAVPFVFSYLAMPVRQMLSGVVLDCSAPIRCRSAVGDEPGLVSYVLPYVLPYLLTHVPEKWGDELVTEWCPGRHYRGCQAEKIHAMRVLAAGHRRSSSVVVWGRRSHPTGPMPGPGATCVMLGGISRW